MDKSKKAPSREELIALLQTKGWDFVTGEKTTPIKKDHTLEEIARAAHAQHKKGETPQIIRRIENALELDLIHIQQIWEYLGLPI